MRVNSDVFARLRSKLISVGLMFIMKCCVEDGNILPKSSAHKKAQEITSDLQIMSVVMYIMYETFIYQFQIVLMIYHLLLRA